MPWNHMQVEMLPDDFLIRPTMGPGQLTRAQAVAEIQSVLDGDSRLAAAAALWRAGAKDDTVHLGPFIWTVYEHDGDPADAARAWLEDFAQTMRAAGVDVQVAL